MINVTKTYLPPIEKFKKYLDKIWESNWVTNQGPLAMELEDRLQKYLGVNHLHFVSNGTIALQIAIKVLGLKGEIITTPYSYVATTTSILWENCTPVFCDINENNFCINPEKIESLITKDTSAILATHVYGIPCDVEKISSIALKHNLKVIYDGAHCFGVRLNGNSLFNFGDVSTASFHATKLFHTIEGGAVFTNDIKLSELIFLYRAFGHLDDEYISIGINGRSSEFNAAMGLCILENIKDFIEERKNINVLYRKLMNELPVIFPDIPENVEYNYSYFPVLFEDNKSMMNAKTSLERNQIFPRRYFHPSLNKLPYVKYLSCPVSESVADRILCLPVYQNLETENIKIIADTISKSINS